ncbi:unnamed protein product, partial [Allacma fusca]
TPYREWSI